MKNTNKTELTVEQRTTAFNEGVIKLSKKYQIGVVPKAFIKEDGTVSAQAHLVDLTATNETTK